MYSSFETLKQRLHFNELRLAAAREISSAFDSGVMNAALSRSQLTPDAHPASATGGVGALRTAGTGKGQRPLNGNCVLYVRGAAHQALVTNHGACRG